MSVLHLNDETFRTEVLEASGPVLVDFWATWCGPCQMMAPVLEEIAAEHPELKVAKVDVDEHQRLAMDYRINSIPALILFRGGKPERQLVGFMPKAALLQKLGL